MHLFLVAMHLFLVALLLLLVRHLLLEAMHLFLLLVSLVDSTASRVDCGTKRLGKPRQNWLHITKKFASENVLRHHNFDENTDDARIYAAALNRDF